MKKELALHLITTILLFIPVFLLRFLNLQNLSNNLIFLPYLIGGLIGAVLPDIDHVIYVYYLKPYELTSQRVMYQAQKGNLTESWNILSNTRSERTNLIFHSILFQIIFVILSFLVITSSSSLLGKGLVIAFLLHLLLDEYLDLKTNINLQNWFKNIPIQLDQNQLTIYLLTNFAIILIFAFLM
ncbi:MAG TPA: metal-dependent hydrolase [Patescibacteria group bacterium]|nr:metal-dependent hydrolase [Patescibacteria group bacterium]